ncbi:MAG: hypothetical protein AAFP90_11115 [Planctomycetota bacterium]
MATFGMLWDPLGQHKFLIQHWMKVGKFMAPFLLTVAFAFFDSHVMLDALLT